jgi:drug/metabolite transporter (DMT)-like permease
MTTEGAAPGRAPRTAGAERDRRPRRTSLSSLTSQPPPARAASRPAPAGATARTRDLGILALCLLAPIWGYGWVATKVALDYSHPLTFAAMRAALSGVGLFVVLIVLRRPLRPPPLLWTSAIAMLQTTAFVGLATWGLHTSGAGKVAVLTYTMPFWLLLLAWAFLRERLRGVQWFAVGLALGGLVLVVSPWRLQGALGSVLTVLGGFSWAASALLVKLLERRHSVDILSLTAWQMLIGAAPLIVIAAVAREGATAWTGVFAGALAYNVILANGVAWLLWLFALRSLSTGAAGLGTLAVPVVGVIAAWLQLGERPGGVEAAGMALIIAALAVLSVRGALATRGARGQAAGGSSSEAPVRPLPD